MTVPMLSLYPEFTHLNITPAHLQSHVRHVRHDNFVTDIKQPTCEMVQLLPYHKRCAHVQTMEQCRKDVFVIDYTNLYYCIIAPEKTHAVVFSILLLLLLCVFLFVILGSTADNFFCPSLKVLAKIMGLSENLAGVTLLAFGNCAPDLFTSVAGIASETREVYNDVTGSACFVLLLVSSAIIIARPFTLPASSFLRDILFMILDIAYLDYIIKSENTVTIYEAVLIIVLYVIYIIVICVDQFLLVRATKNLRQKSIAFGSLQTDHRLRVLQSEAQIDILSRSTHRPTVIAESLHSVHFPRRSHRNSGLFKQFVDTINVFDLDEYRRRNCFSRALMVLKSPILFALTLFLPVVDYELELNGWSKLLNCLQVVVLPSCLLLTFGLGGYSFLSVAIIFWLQLIFIPLALLIFFLSRTDTPPIFHKYFSILGLVGSVFVVYACASELIQILQMLGIITHRSNSFLGCTLLAWGNSVGDLIANLAMANHGYQRMGFAACIGGPLFNTLITVGAIFVYRTATNEDYEYKTGEGTLGENSTIFLLIGLFTLMLAALTTDFKMRRTVGMVPLTIYIIYLLFCILSEFEFIHPFGSDHRLDLRAEPADF